MAKQVANLDVTFEAASALVPNTFFSLNSSGVAVASSADDLTYTGVVISTNGATVAPFAITARLEGIAQVQSDGSGAIAPADMITTAASGQAKKRVVASGAVRRRMAGQALSNVAATAGLLIDILLTPHEVIST